MLLRLLYSLRDTSPATFRALGERLPAVAALAHKLDTPALLSALEEFLTGGWAGERASVLAKQTAPCRPRVRIHARAGPCCARLALERMRGTAAATQLRVHRRSLTTSPFAHPLQTCAAPTPLTCRSCCTACARPSTAASRASRASCSILLPPRSLPQSWQTRSCRRWQPSTTPPCDGWCAASLSWCRAARASPPHGGAAGSCRPQRPLHLCN